MSSPINRNPVEVRVNSTRRNDTGSQVKSKYQHQHSFVTKEGAGFIVEERVDQLEFSLDKKIRSTGVLIVGLGGNNGSTFFASALANRNNISFQSREGLVEPNWLGSVAESSTIFLGHTDKEEEVHVPFHSLVPMLRANDIAIGGWDINNANLYDACNTSCVLEYDMKEKLKADLEKVVPMPGIYRESFIAQNQKARVNNIIPGGAKDQVEVLRNDIAKFKADNHLDFVVVLWSANTERYSEHKKGIHDSVENMLKAVENNEPELAPSLLYAVAALQEGCCFINGSPQNTFCPGLIDMASQKGLFLAGNDFKTGQTKVKSVLADFLVKAGLKLRSVVSYNHLGNNDGRNLSSAAQFRSKEISKSNVIDDVLNSNGVMYPDENSHPDHAVVIKYIPFVGDSKRAIDEYTAEGMLGSRNTIMLYNTCEDSMLAVPLMMDLVIFSEFCSRLMIGQNGAPEPPDAVMTLLSLFLKAPEARPGRQVINSFYAQRGSITNFIRIVAGLVPEDFLRMDQLVNCHK